LPAPRPSLISVEGRIQRFDRFSNHFLAQYELLMGTVNESDKASLAQYVQWIKENLPTYLTTRHLNQVIPGQLSYNDKSLIKEAGLFVTVSAKPSLKAVEYLLSCLALGCGVSVACITEASYVTWKGILDLAWKAGFSKPNLDITLISEQSLVKLLNASSYSFVYAGHFAQYADSIYKEIVQDQALSENMRQILSEVDGVPLENPVSVLDQFVWTRS